MFRSLSKFSLAGILICVGFPTLADEAKTLDTWYTALLASDGARLADLMTEDATIRLDDIGITQSREEFLASMEEWERAIAGGDIRYRIEDDAELGEMAVTVCYQFTDNEMLTREVFRFENALIAESVQSGIGDDCGGL